MEEVKKDGYKGLLKTIDKVCEKSELAIDEGYSFIILSDKNLGYAKGNNLGLSLVKTKYALIINPDAKVKNQAIDSFFFVS